MIVLPKKLSERLAIHDIGTIKTTLDTLVKMQEDMLLYVTKMVYDFYTEYGYKQPRDRVGNPDTEKGVELIKHHE